MSVAWHIPRHTGTLDSEKREEAWKASGWYQQSLNFVTVPSHPVLWYWANYINTCLLLFYSEYFSKIRRAESLPTSPRKREKNHTDEVLSMQCTVGIQIMNKLLLFLLSLSVWHYDFSITYLYKWSGVKKLPLSDTQAYYEQQMKYICEILHTHRLGSCPQLILLKNICRYILHCS